MNRPRVIDTFMLNNELDVLTCRLTEIADAVDYFVLVEATTDHQAHPKALHYAENKERFAPWEDKIVHVVADDLPTLEDSRDAWSREHAQREHVPRGLATIGVGPDDVVLHGDCDEIPRAVVARNVRPRGMVAFDMACYSMAVDWQHPDRWRGTVAARVRNIHSFTYMRDARNVAPALPNAGWHLGWLGGTDAQLSKLGSFCHPEIADRTLAGIEAGHFLTDGYHVDGAKLIPVDVDSSWPRWVAERKCPPAWFRERPVFHEDWFGEASQRALADLYTRVRDLPGLVVEVGCWEGRSTCALARACFPAVLAAVDTWEGSPGEISAELAAERDVYGTFVSNVAKLTKGNVEPFRMGWREFFASHAAPLKFVHIDATHTYEEVRDNIAAALPLTVSGAIICGDDAHHEPVMRAVLEHFPDVQRTATLWWAQIP